MGVQIRGGKKWGNKTAAVAVLSDAPLLPIHFCAVAHRRSTRPISGRCCPIKRRPTRPPALQRARQLLDIGPWRANAQGRDTSAAVTSTGCFPPAHMVSTTVGGDHRDMGVAVKQKSV